MLVQGLWGPVEWGMARKPRIEFPGAIYHVISRGNYRKNLFHDYGSGKAFEKALFEAADFSNWWLHGYTIMSNHYHAVIETPEANLSTGMQWLQGTFGNRFNRVHGEHGHVFQGRFKSPLVEPGEGLRRVVDYVHLNPVRARIVPVGKLHCYRLSSYQKFWLDPLHPRLTRKGFLSPLGLPDSLEGMKAYEKWLTTRDEGDPDKEEELRNEFEKGWILGSSEFRRAIQDRFCKVKPAADWGGPELSELLQGKWERLIQEEMGKRKLAEEDFRSSPKLAVWKIEISRRLRKETNASNGWIAKRLHMGHPSNVSRYLRCTPKSKG